MSWFTGVKNPVDIAANTAAMMFEPAAIAVLSKVVESAQATADATLAKPPNRSRADCRVEKTMPGMLRAPSMKEIPTSTVNNSRQAMWRDIFGAVQDLLASMPNVSAIRFATATSAQTIPPGKTNPNAVGANALTTRAITSMTTNITIGNRSQVGSRDNPTVLVATSAVFLTDRSDALSRQSAASAICLRASAWLT